MRANLNGGVEKPTCADSFQLESIVADCLDALGRVDADRLERRRDLLRESDAGGMVDRQVGIELGVHDLPTFARVLQAMETTFHLMARYRCPDSAGLEYLPHPANRGRITRN